MKNFNLTEWALNHQQFIVFTMLLVFGMGMLSYRNLGRMEFPDFVIRQMVVSVAWPGASARQVEEQVTDKIEKKLQDTPGLNFLKSYSRPGQSVIFVHLEDTMKTEDIRPTWQEVRNMVNDLKIKGSLPDGVVGPYFNDRFDDVFGCIYALTSDGYSLEEMRVHAENIRQILLGIDDVKKVELQGVQPEKIYIEMESSKLAQLGINPEAITSTIAAQNAMAASGMIETASDNIYLRVTGMFEDLESIRSIPIRANNGTFRLDDIAKVSRSYAEPAEPKMYYNGQPAIGIALSMAKGGNILTLGQNLTQTAAQIQQTLPLGLELHQVANQPLVVKDAIHEFIKSLGEAVVIVLAVCLMSLGLHTGVVVALCIPLVICGVFLVMKIAGIDLQNISLGALIIALGLLVDDAIIAVEMMTVKLEQGWDRFKAACYAYNVTAFPMLTGTLVTCAGFIPVGFSKGSASEMVGCIFTVVTIALLISWVVAAAVTPLLGYYLIRVEPPAAHAPDHDIYDTRFYRSFRGLLNWCLRYRFIVLLIVAAMFIGSLQLMKSVKQEFFPSTARPELVVDMYLPEGASLAATAQEAEKFAKCLEGDDRIENYTYYVGQGAPRFVLTFEIILPSPNFVQFIILAKDTPAREALRVKVKQLFAEKFANVRGHTKLIQFGPPDPYPVTLRVTGYDKDKVREIAQQVEVVMAAQPYLREVNMDWNEKNKVMHLTIDQKKARQLGITRKTLATALQSQVSGVPMAEFREGDKRINMVFRLDVQNRNNLTRIKDLNIPLSNGGFVPLDQIAQIGYEAEEGLIWRRSLKPTITVQAEVIPGILGDAATKQVYASLTELRKGLPLGYAIEIGGAVERSQDGLRYLLEPVPFMIVAMVLLLMFQVQNISKMLLTMFTAPLGLIGVSVTMLLLDRPMGFVAQLGILALIGIIIRNSVILVDQIDRQVEAGESLWNGIINAAVLRFRPIMLTAAAAILGMIPLFSSVFWGPMAVAIAGGLFAATVLTLIVLPVMYAAWYRVKPAAA